MKHEAWLNHPLQATTRRRYKAEDGGKLKQYDWRTLSMQIHNLSHIYVNVVINKIPKGFLQICDKIEFMILCNSWMQNIHAIPNIQLLNN